MMNLDELAFLNRQLASMLKDGLPLEGALQQLSKDVSCGKLRSEFEALQASLASGESMESALKTRRFPRVYHSLLLAGARSGNLPGVLLLAADHYEASHSLHMRVRAALFYPAMVFAIMIFLAFALARLNKVGQQVMESFMGGASEAGTAHLWLAVFLILGPLALLLLVLGVRKFRHIAIWKIPGFREASLADLASTMELLLRAGCSLPDSLQLVGDMEVDSPAGKDIAIWKDRLAAGVKGPGDLLAPAAGRSTFPALFRWLVSCGGEDVASGFQMAAGFFRERARHRLEVIVYAIAPVGLVIMSVCAAIMVLPFFANIVRIMQSLGSEDGG
jgi:type II secretory pathway component PulF